MNPSTIGREAAPIAKTTLENVYPSWGWHVERQTDVIRLTQERQRDTRHACHMFRTLISDSRHRGLSQSISVDTLRGALSTPKVVGGRRRRMSGFPIETTETSALRFPGGRVDERCATRAIGPVPM